MRNDYIIFKVFNFVKNIGLVEAGVIVLVVALFLGGEKVDHWVQSAVKGKKKQKPKGGV